MDKDIIFCLIIIHHLIEQNRKNCMGFNKIFFIYAKWIVFTGELTNRICRTIRNIMRPKLLSVTALFKKIFVITANQDFVGAVAHICHHFFSLRAAVKQVAAHYEFMLRVAIFKAGFIKSRFHCLKKTMNIRHNKIFHLLSPLPLNIFKIRLFLQSLLLIRIYLS